MSYSGNWFCTRSVQCGAYRAHHPFESFRLLRSGEWTGAMVAPERASEGRRVAVVRKHDLTTTEQVGIERKGSRTEQDECGRDHCQSQGTRSLEEQTRAGTCGRRCEDYE